MLYTLYLHILHHLQAMKMTFLDLFLFCIFKDLKLAEKWTNSAENPKKNWTLWSSWSSFFPSLTTMSVSNYSLVSQYLEFCQALASMGQIIFVLPDPSLHFASIWGPKLFTWTPYLNMFIVSHKLWALWKRLGNCWFFFYEGGLCLFWSLWLCVNKHV